MASSVRSLPSTASRDSSVGRPPTSNRTGRASARTAQVILDGLKRCISHARGEITLKSYVVDSCDDVGGRASSAEAATTASDAATARGGSKGTPRQSAGANLPKNIHNYPGVSQGLQG